MIRAAALLALVPALALAQESTSAPETLPEDAPKIIEVSEGQVLTPEGAITVGKGVFLNPAAVVKVEAVIYERAVAIARLQAENEQLVTAIDEQANHHNAVLEARDSDAFKRVLIVAAGALVVGAAAGVGAVILLKK